jgi:hypothetical protein
MSTSTVSPSAARAIRMLLLLTGALLIAYAISDHPLYGGDPGFGATQAAIALAGAVLALCTLLPVEAAGRILLFAVTGLLMLAFAEIAGESFLKSRFRPVYQHDERLIFKFIPGRDSVMTRSPVNGGNIVAHHINSAGFRGDELLPAGTAPRIAVYGDSFIHAFYSPEAETFASQLGAQFENRTGRKFEIVNASVSSYGPDQISLKMEEELPGLRPGLVIVSIFAGNDYGDLMRNKMFRLGTNGELVTNRWELDPGVRASFELSQRESIIKRALRSLLGSWRPADYSSNTGVDFLLAEAEREYRSFIVERNDIVTNTHADYYSADVSLTPKSASARYKAALMGAVMGRIRDLARQNGTPLVFLFIPHPVDVADNYDNWRIDRRRFPDYDGRNQTAPLEDAARALGVPFISLYDSFRKAGANSLYFHQNDDHWNGAGQRLAAQLVSDFLLSGGLIPPGQPEGIAR